MISILIIPSSAQVDHSVPVMHILPGIDSDYENDSSRIVSFLEYTG